MMRCCVSCLLAVISACLLLTVPSCVGEGDPGRIRGENGELSLVIAVALTNNGVPFLEPGWAHMASAVLAAKHFNEKDPTVVSQLEEYADCPFRFSNISVIDTGTNSHLAMKSLLQRIQDVGIVDAIAGPYNEQPAMELSVLATGMESPIVAFRGLDHNLVLPDKHPYYSQINPDLYGEMEFIAEYLKHTNRTNYVAILYSNEDSVLQRMETLQTVLKEKVDCDQVKAYSYLSVSKAQAGEDRGLRDAVMRVSQTGFRTIVLLTATPDLDTPGIGAAAHEYDLDQGGHFWIIPGGLDPSGTNRDNILVQFQHKQEGGFLRGAAYSSMFEGHNVNDDDPFEHTLSSQNASFVEYLRNLNPIANYTGKFFCKLNDLSEKIDPAVNPQCTLPDNFFQELPFFGERVGFAYDATMSIGIGACMAIAGKTNSTALTGKEHLDGIQSVNFKGASGQVRFRNRPGTPGSRDASSPYYGILNLLPRGGASEEILQATSYVDPDINDWVDVFPFVYSDGSNSPPTLLRTTPEQNYLDPVVRGIGLTLMSISLLFIAASAIWVWRHRNHRVVIAAQPPFLYVLCVGSTLFSMVILVNSFDESHGWTDSMLDKACVATPWLYILGDMIVYSALFTKLWRVNKVLQFKRARVKVRQVVWPGLFLVLAAIVLLSVWTAVDDFGWYRQEIDEVSGETIGRCIGTYTGAFLIPVGIICTIPTLLTCIMAWKTCDVDDMYSESKWIFSLVLVQIQVIVVGIPVVVILQSVSTNGRYIGVTLITWTFPMSTLGLIMVPKMYALRKEQMGVQKSISRGSSKGVVVSGLTHPTKESQNTRSSGNTTRGSGEHDADPLQPANFDVSSSRVQTVIMH
ncbi:Gamma-aminobutyric acid (GABA) B receptor [Seminavis robusta]|uniref:Gamma-aminobutyric acid (GABA) B receptor n=1 Tax=Seminavis robusta TaxID=568900 RepID=A0A9N8DIU9_9STRA|nr:Gamma-aminobutyric acid (GABA) B receptor [Seminavis robusta]|eukprot:Sro85_g045160.1 Gamma-aminobutyric acid (GABA) B receptor (856) ;mRNA; f:16336-19383